VLRVRRCTEDYRSSSVIPSAVERNGPRSVGLQGYVVLFLVHGGVCGKEEARGIRRIRGRRDNKVRLVAHVAPDSEHVPASGTAAHGRRSCDGMR